MAVASLTSGQSTVYRHLTDEPRETSEIAKAAGMHVRTTYNFLMALKAKGLCSRELNASPTTWRRVG